jgi:hypothetical protein
MMKAKRVGIVGLTVVCLAGALPFGGCGIGGLVDPINNIANQIEAAISAIDINSSQWQEIVRDLMDELPDAENDLKADVDEVLQRGIKATTVSVIASGDFVSRRVQEGLDRLKAEVTGRPAPVYPPAFLGFTPDAVDVARVLDDELNAITLYGYDFDRRDPAGNQLKLFVLRDGDFEECSFALTLATHYEAKINLAANGVQMSLGCTLMQLRWDDQVISTLPILQPDPPQPEDVVINLQSITFKPGHTRGDKDFKGHGPYVRLEASIACDLPVLGGCGGLMAHVYMFAEETESDWTTASGTSEWENVYRTPPGYRIIDILTPVFCADSYTDTSHSEDVICPGNGSLVACFRCMGDTDGDDAGVATKVSVDFAPCTVRMIKDDPYFK